MEDIDNTPEIHFESGFETVRHRKYRNDNENESPEEQEIDAEYLNSDICDVFSDMKQWCEEQCIYLLDICRADDFIDFVIATSEPFDNIAPHSNK